MLELDFVQPRPTMMMHIKEAMVRTYGVKMQTMRPPLPMVTVDVEDDVGMYVCCGCFPLLIGGGRFDFRSEQVVK